MEIKDISKVKLLTNKKPIKIKMKHINTISIVILIIVLYAFTIDIIANRIIVGAG